MERNGEELLAKVTDPFVTTRSGKWVDIPLFAGAAQRCDGNFKIDSKQGRVPRLKPFSDTVILTGRLWSDMALTISHYSLQS